MLSINRPRSLSAPDPATVPSEMLGVRQITGGERIDQIAFEAYGDPRLWRVIAKFNSLRDPGRLPTGLLLRIPPLASLEVDQ